jgi:hypothetical protein
MVHTYNPGTPGLEVGDPILGYILRPCLKKHLSSSSVKE